MSYLTLPEGIPDFARAVISLWFRAPKESVIKATTRDAIGDESFPMLESILPLVTLGRPQNLTVPLASQRDVAVIHPHSLGAPEPDPSTTYYATDYAWGPSYEVDPTLIGLKCYSNGTFSVVIHIQTKDRMSLQASSFITTQMDLWSGSDPAAPVASLGNGVGGIFPNVGLSTIQDVSHFDSDRQPEYFTVIPTIVLQADHWHHLLLSFDIRGVVSVGTPFASSQCRLWYAIDDVDYRGAENLRPYRDLEADRWGKDNLDPNAIITGNVHRHSGVDPDQEGLQYYQNHYVGLPSGTLGGASIPSADAEMGFPASGRYVDGIVRVEMAEFQMWTDVTLDTGIVGNRRAFIDDDGKPTPPITAEEMMGKRPEIMLHRSGNWKKGKNTGSTGTDDDGELIPSGQFEPTAKIETYRPDPSLHGRQGYQTPAA